MNTAAHEVLRQRAYHEAGHAAVAAFTGCPSLSDIAQISIRPEIAAQDKDGGGVRYRGFSDPSECSRPFPWRKYDVRRWLLFTLAGHAAEEILHPQEGDELIEALWDLDDEGDLGHAWTLAALLRAPLWPARRHMRLAERWTFEALHTPIVWATMERVAGVLLQQHTINDREQIEDLLAPLENLGLRGRPWRRRLVPTRYDAAEAYRRAQ